jgi:hypothetical protein
MKRIFILAIINLCITFGANAQTCFSNIANLTGFDLAFGQPTLESHACSLKNQVNGIFNLQSGEFKVFSAHQYLHISSLTEALKAEQINLVKSQCEQTSPFYLAIITQGDRYGLFKNFKVILKLPTQTQIPCLNQSKIAQIEDKVRQYIERKYDGSMYTVPDALAQSMDYLSGILTNLSQNNCCVLTDYEILSMFKQNGFRGIPINREPPSIARPQARFNNANLNDFANLNFTLDGRDIDLGSMDLQGISAEFIVTKNENLCDGNGEDYQEAQSIFASENIVFWYHIWISPDSMNSDLLLLKAKPNGGITDVVPASVVYLKRLEKEVIQYDPKDDLISSAPQYIEFEIPVYAFTSAAVSLLSKLSDTIPNAEEEIKNVEIRNTGRGGFFPAYDPNDGGGGMTFPWFENRHQAVIQYTANFFATSGFTCCNNGNDPDSWLSISAHEVIHIKHIRECDCGTLVYFGSFAWEYATNLGHDTSPREIEADYGYNRYNQFNLWLRNNKKSSISAIFSNTMGDGERKNKINELWNDYPNK